MSEQDVLTAELVDLVEVFLRLRRNVVNFVKGSREALDGVYPDHRDSAENLLHYLALRGSDLRPLQGRLATVGLSSLGRAESHVLSSVDAVLAVLHRALNRQWDPEPPDATAVDLDAGQRLLAAHTRALLGFVPPERGVAIMVTLPSEAADDYMLVHRLIEHGMDCVRINCAHDDEAAWARMLGHVRRAEQTMGRECRVLMDLAGPKIRTGPVEPGPAVVKVRPTRDALGRVTQPARIWLAFEERPRTPPTPADAAIELPEVFLEMLQVGDRLTFTDARGSDRACEVVAVGVDGGWAESTKTCYLTANTLVRIERDGVEDIGDACVGAIPPTEGSIALASGDLLLLTRDLAPGRAAVSDRAGLVLNPAAIGCTSAQVFEDAQPGEHVWIDDGRIGSVIERKEPDRLHLRITHAPPRGARLHADKGLNFPDSQLRLDAMTDKDRLDLAFVSSHADMVALSFVNTIDDVRALQTLLSPLGDRRPGIVLKIETKRGLVNLPAMLLEAMKAPRCGVMIARGDLAVECGFERLAEVQEEILWFCEAAHVPTIWATQVLESLAKTGQPSRAEITDAAMSNRAECVMLNKGPYITEAVQMLDDILRRMHGHQAKKSPQLRELRLVSGFRRARKARPARTTRSVSS
jgi:pyruvate kinase